MARKATLDWLEISGPLYVEMPVVFRRMTDFVEVLMAEDEGVATYAPRQMSFASWHMCAQAKPGDVLVLKLRCDDTSVRNAE